jgi:16S rRNA processing protein RimM
MVVMGRVAAPFGVRGWVRVVPWSEAPDTLLGHPVWALRSAGGGAWRDVALVEAKQQGPGIVALFRDVGSREAAAALRGCEVGLPREALATPKAGEYYWTELEALEVVNRAGQSLGRVVGVAGNGAHPILRVAGQGQERLIPFVPAYVDRVDVAGGRIAVDWQPDY